MRNLCLHLIKYLSLASIIWVSSAFKATAQMVKGEICDSSLSKKAYITQDKIGRTECSITKSPGIIREPSLVINL